MRLEKRDWLILRGRLRRFVSLAALPVMTAVILPVCAADVDDEVMRRLQNGSPAAGIRGPCS